MFVEQLISVLGANIRVPNQIMTPAADGFYVSFNDSDTAIYGDVTTALVIGQMERFLILNGDHRKAYAELSGKGAGIDAYVTYFLENQSQLNKHSDPAPARTVH